MWSGRLREPLHPEFEQWQRSFGFDWRLLPHEVAASKAHAAMLAQAGLLTPAEATALRTALDAVGADFGATGPRAAEMRAHPDAEDIHHFVELQLVERLGDLGQKLHTGRSRNEQVATDLRLYVRAQCAAIAQFLQDWMLALIQQADAAGDAVMPAYTHLQRAEPVLVAHWLLCYMEMLARDVSRFADCARRLNECPLGSGAVAGATLALDRNLAAIDLAFRAPTRNSMDATSDRDFVLEFLHAATLLALHASRFAEEITLFATAEFAFVELPDAFSTGSSAMPQKKNPDLTELVRARVGRINGAAQAVTLQIKGLPLAYNKDLQETQYSLYEAVDALVPMLPLLAEFTQALRFRTDRMEAACRSGYLNAMAAATYLSQRGVPFRRAHSIVGEAVRYALAKGCELDALSLAELRQFAPEFDEDFFPSITLEATVACHDVTGGTGYRHVHEALAETRRKLQPEEVAHAHS